MTDLVEFGSEFDVDDVDEIRAQRDEIVNAVRDHATTIAYQFARLQGGEYGRLDLSTTNGTWTIKHEAGELEFLRFSPSSGADTYVVSTKQPPEPADLASALRDYGNFVAAWNEHVESLDGVLDDVSIDVPEPDTTAGVVAERDRVLSSIRSVADRIASEIYRYEGDEYGTFTVRVDGVRWELKWELGRTSYLRVGGSGGVYLLSQYDAPSAADVREYADPFRGFVDAYNDHVNSIESDLARIDLLSGDP